MSRHELRLWASKAALGKLPTTDFLWRPKGEPSSFETSLSPRAEELGAVPPANVELIRLAVLAYLVDRTAARPTRCWGRELELVVPVFDPDRWAAVGDRVNAMLEFLTGDVWDVSFITARSPANKKVKVEVEPVERVTLFSGGADSLCGLLVSLRAGVVPHLVSHSNWTIVSGAQRKVLDALKPIVAVPLTRDLVRLGRQTRQVGSGLEFPLETTSRARSLLFIALGFAAAAVRHADLWVPENGFASLNLPLAQERRGALSTRTTHPRLLDEFGEIAKAVGIDVGIHTPFEDKTKGEMFAQVAADYDKNDAAAILSASHSCARSGANYAGFRPSTHCGVCFGCLVRRAAFAASGLKDGTVYIEESLRSEAKNRAEWLKKRREDVAAVEYRVKRPYEISDVLAASLPLRVDPDVALDIANRGVAELALLRIPR
jgi:hypothetical protein